jgi:hypothetical protein
MNTIGRILMVLALAVVAPAGAHAQRTMVAGSFHWGSRVYTPASVETYAVWIRMPATNVASVFINTTRGPVADNHYRVMGYGVGYFYASERAGISGYNSQSNALPLANTWIHVCAIWKGPTNRTVWVNGVSAAAETTSVSPTSIDEVHLGRLTTSSGNYYCSADLAEPAIWHAELTASEIGQLAAGGAFARRAHPSRIRPDKLVWLPDLTIPGAAVPGVGGVTGISNSPALLTAIPPAFR